MDTKGIVDAVMEHVGSAPDKVKEFLADPGATIEQLTGQQLDADGISEVAQGVVAKIQENGGELGAKLGELLQSDQVSDALAGLKDKLGDLPVDEALGAIGDKLGGLFGKK